jgi:serine/threonine protein kinase
MLLDLGLPVPDALLFDDLSPVSFEEGAQSLSPCLRFTGAREFAARFGFTLLSDSPLRSSCDSTVYVGQTAFGEDRALKFSSRRMRLMSEFAHRQCLGDCPFLVVSYDVYDAEFSAMLEVEFCPGRDIQARHLFEPECWRLCRDIATALYHVHSLGYVHIDVSPRNILQSGHEFKLADFGTLTPDGEIASEGAGPYASPEILACLGMECGVSYPTDIFSFGICLVEAASGFFAPRGNGRKYDLIRNGTLKLGSQDYPCPYSSGFVAMVNAMLAPDPTRRPTAGMIVEMAKWAIGREVSVES